MRMLLLLFVAGSLVAGCSKTCETDADCLPPSVCRGCPPADDDDSSEDISYREDCTPRRCRTPAQVRQTQNQS